MFSLQQNWRTRGLNMFSFKGRDWGMGGEVDGPIYTHISKYRNDKIVLFKLQILKMIKYVLKNASPCE
jgi:hypothetical protein